MIEELFKKLLAPKPTSNMSGFKFSDLLDNDRWRTAQRDSYSPKRGELRVEGDPFSGVDYRQYVPRASGTATSTGIGPDAVVSPDSLTSVGWVHGQGISDPGSPRVTYDSDWRGADRRHYERNQGTTVKRTTDNNGGVTTTETTKFLPYERLADINKSRFTPARFMPSTYAEEGPAMASYAPPTMRNQFAEEGPGMGSYAPWSDRAGARPPMERGPYSMRGSFAEDGPGQRSIPQSYGPAGQIAHRMQPSGYRRPVRQTSATTYPYNMVPQADVGLIPISTQSTPQPRKVPLSFSNQSQLERFPEGIFPVEGMTDAMKRRMLELFLSGDGMKLMRSD